MMHRPFVKSLLSLAAFVLLIPAATCAQRPQQSDDEAIRNACVMVKAHITRRGQPPIASATGTGFFVAKDLILTCNHCTRIPMQHGMVDANDVQVELDGGQFVRAQVVARDPAHDLALLKVNAEAAEKAGCQPLSITSFDLSSGSPITIVGNFPEAIRLTRGELVARSVMAGFAMGSAKVRSGFSGGPVLTADGKVQGILSQRDDDNNSIFVRSDVILSLLNRQGWTAPESAPAQNRRDALTVAAADGRPENQVAAGAETSDAAEFEPASSSEKSADKETADAAVIVALPVRPTSK